MGNQYNYRHGMYLTSEYKAWNAIIQRCTNPNDKRYPLYGGRGIKVCNSWRDFRNFYADMGDKPSPDSSIERINNNGNYKPSNCRWATRKEQSRNTRKTVFLTYNGKTQCMADWAEELHIKASTLQARLSTYGWTVEEALTPDTHKGMRPMRKREESGAVITFKNETLSVEEWAERLGISQVALRFRLSRWPLEKALTQKRRAWTRQS